MNLIKAIVPKILEKDGDDDRLNLYAIAESVDDWPKVKDEDGELEDLDLENVEIIKIDQDEIIVWGGGDWQSPMKVTIQMVGGRMKVVSAEDGGNYNDHTFLSEDEIEEALKRR